MKYPPAPLSKSLLDMDVANYCEGLDPTYSTLGFDNADVLYGGGGETHTHTYAVYTHTHTYCIHTYTYMYAVYTHTHACDR